MVGTWLNFPAFGRVETTIPAASRRKNSLIRNKETTESYGAIRSLLIGSCKLNNMVYLRGIQVISLERGTVSPEA